ncbi:hypothetical protein Misp06_04475 [Microbulbifer sp. NBRC 101763]
MLSFSSRMHCEKCFFQYEYTSLSKWVIAFYGACIPILAIYMGLALQSLVVFGSLLLAAPFLAEFVFAKYCSLKPVGIRALREKLRGKSL